MAAPTRRDPQPRAKRTYTAGSFQPNQRETADQRRTRRLELTRTAQADLKREAAERRASKRPSS